MKKIIAKALAAFGATIAWEIAIDGLFKADLVLWRLLFLTGCTAIYLIAGRAILETEP